MRLLFLIIPLLIFSIEINSQNKKSKWTFSVNLASVKYAASDGEFIGEEFINQSPRFTLSRYLFSGLTFEAGYSASVVKDENYKTHDAAVRYSLDLYKNKVVPYVLLGGSYIKAKELTHTFNVGVGNTFWFSNRGGLNIQFLYKFSGDQFKTTQRSHLMTSIGFVYSIKSRALFPRLWNRYR